MIWISSSANRRVQQVRKKVVQAIFSMFSSSYLVVERVQVLKVVQAPGLSDYRGEDGFQVAR